MAEDLYTIWLRIPPGPRPPDYYSLLGLPQFCSDLKQIDRGAEIQMERLDRRALHPDPILRDACQRMMNEVARARTILASPARRADYDETLRGDQRPARLAPSAPAKGMSPRLAFAAGAASVLVVLALVKLVTHQPRTDSVRNTIATTVRETPIVPETSTRSSQVAHPAVPSTAIATTAPIAPPLAVVTPSIVATAPSHEGMPSDTDSHAQFSVRISLAKPAVHRDATKWTKFQIHFDRPTDSGYQLAFPYVGWAADGRIYVHSLLTGERTSFVMLREGALTSPRLSGSTVAFVQTVQGETGRSIFAYDLVTGKTTRVCADFDTQFDMRDGVLAYDRDGDIDAFDVATSTTTRLTVDGAAKTNLLVMKERICWIQSIDPQQHCVMAFDLQSRSLKPISEPSNELSDLEGAGDVITWLGPDNHELFHDFRYGTTTVIPQLSAASTPAFTDGNRIIWGTLFPLTKAYTISLYDLKEQTVKKLTESKLPCSDPVISPQFVAWRQGTMENQGRNSDLMLLLPDGVTIVKLGDSMFGSTTPKIDQNCITWSVSDAEQDPPDILGTVAPIDLKGFAEAQPAPTVAGTQPATQPATEPSNPFAVQPVNPPAQPEEPNQSVKVADELLSRGWYTQAIGVARRGLGSRETSATTKAVLRSILKRALMSYAEATIQFGNIGMAQEAVHECEPLTETAIDPDQLAKYKAQLVTLGPDTPPKQLSQNVITKGMTTLDSTPAGYAINGTLQVGSSDTRRAGAPDWLRLLSGCYLTKGTMILPYASVDLRGTREFPIVLANVAIVSEGGTSNLNAAYTIFDECGFQAGISPRERSRWTMDHCFFSNCIFKGLSPRDYSIDFRDCVFNNCVLPNRDFWSTEREKQAYAGAPSRIDSCQFYECGVPVSDVWVMNRCNFYRCYVSDNGIYSEPTDIDVALGLLPDDKTFIDQLTRGTTQVAKGNVSYSRAAEFYSRMDGTNFWNLARELPISKPLPKH